MSKNVNQFDDMVYEDISSSSVVKKDSFAKTYSEGAFKHIDKVIKIISFFVSITTFFIFAGAAVVLVMIDKAFIAIAIGVGIFGILTSLILLFLIYGIGHIITQNKEILKRL